jgi:general stress protein 26
MMQFRIILFTALYIFFFSNSFSQQKEQDADRAKILEAAKEIMISAGMCALITLDETGSPQVHTMDPFAPEKDFTVWLATNPKSRKVNQIRNNPDVTLYYADKDNQGYVTIHGTAELVNEQQEKDKRWKEEWKNYYSNRTDQYLLIKVTPEYLEVISYPRGLSGDPATWKPVRILFR